ncbi:MAG: HAMP domain-containing sensor histidine kinase, partial [Spirochaetales bacterium]|nr:HAMP domain-containing sensor histidine kinase [Spirochaetales bacterium]
PIKELSDSASAAEKLQDELIYNEKMQTNWLQDITHDLKAPIAALGIQLDASLNGALKIDNERLEKLIEETRQLNEMVNELSLYTSIRTGEIKITKERILLRSFLTEILDRFKSVADKKNIKLELGSQNLDSEILFDKKGLYRIFNNLVINAINNTAVGENIYIYVNKNEHTLTVSIENPGCVSEEELPLLFNRLFRSKDSGYEGRGLGLAISNAIAENNDSKISVHNTDTGTVVFNLAIATLNSH